MEEAERLTRNVQNNNPDDEDWDTRVNKLVALLFTKNDHAWTI